MVTALPDHARAVYCTPAHQYPLGATLSASRRLALVAWVLEDDYDGELRYHGVPLPLLATLGERLRRVRRELLARRDLLVGALRAASLSVLGDQAGAHLVVDLPGEQAEFSAVRRARCEGLLLDGWRAATMARPFITGWLWVTPDSATGRCLPRCCPG